MLILEARKDERRRSGKSNVNDRNFYQNEYYRIKKFSFLENYKTIA